jgi:hypothetical protein
MKRWLAGVAATAVVVGGVAPAQAWNCGVQIRKAEEAIKTAEGMKLPPEAKQILEEARKLVAESRSHHGGAKAKIDHAHAMWKAKAALAQAEAVQAISTPQ